ncbi:MAG: tetratricopeptide repeat protein [Anaerolineae bacterium]|jgi:tetratricopeptide (TPR) repeat protein|nr:tetratricopeptide repeat protein [Anaerolineae bacterium]
MFFQSKQQKAAKKVEQAKAKLQTGEWRDVIKLLEEASDLDPMDPEIFALIGNTYQRLEEYEPAVLNFQKAVRLDPNDQESVGRIAVCKIKLAQSKQDKAKDDKPLPKPQRGVSHAVSVMQAYNEAQAEFKRNPRKNAELASVPAAKAGLDAIKETAKHDLAGALNQFEDLLKAHNNIAELYYTYAVTMASVNVPDMAARGYTFTILLNPRFTDAYLNRCAIWNSIGRFNEIIADMDIVIGYEPDNFDAYIRRGIAYQSKGEMKSANRDFEKVFKADLRNHPDIGVLHKKADLLFNQKDLVGALEAYEALLARSDITPAIAADAHYGHAKVLLNMGLPEDSLDSAKKAMNLIPANPNYCHLVGEAAKQAGMWVDAAAGWRAYVATVKAGRQGFLPQDVAEHFLREAEQRI